MEHEGKYFSRSKNVEMFQWVKASGSFQGFEANNKLHLFQIESYELPWADTGQNLDMQAPDEPLLRAPSEAQKLRKYR